MCCEEAEEFPEIRQARDGEWYRRWEFEAHYGDEWGAWMWVEAKFPIGANVADYEAWIADDIDLPLAEEESLSEDERLPYPVWSPWRQIPEEVIMAALEMHQGRGNWISVPSRLGEHEYLNEDLVSAADWLSNIAMDSRNPQIRDITPTERQHILQLMQDVAPYFMYAREGPIPTQQYLWCSECPHQQLYANGDGSLCYFRGNSTTSLRIPNGMW